MGAVIPFELIAYLAGAYLGLRAIRDHGPQDRPPAPPLAGQRPHPTSPGGGANPHA